MPYEKIGEVPASLRGIEPPITVDQANWIARVAEGIDPEKVKSPWAVAIGQFKRAHKVEDGHWVKKNAVDMRLAVMKARALGRYGFAGVVEAIVKGRPGGQWAGGSEQEAVGRRGG